MRALSILAMVHGGVRFQDTMRASFLYRDGTMCALKSWTSKTKGKQGDMATPYIWRFKYRSIRTDSGEDENLYKELVDAMEADPGRDFFFAQTKGENNNLKAKINIKPPPGQTETSEYLKAASDSTSPSRPISFASSTFCSS